MYILLNIAYTCIARVEKLVNLKAPHIFTNLKFPRIKHLGHEAIYSISKFCFSRVVFMYEKYLRMDFFLSMECAVLEFLIRKPQYGAVMKLIHLLRSDQFQNDDHTMFASALNSSFCYSLSGWTLNYALLSNFYALLILPFCFSCLIQISIC